MSPTPAPRSSPQIQPKSAGLQSTKTPLQNQQSRLMELCRMERERLNREMLEKMAKIPKSTTRSPHTDPGWGSLKSLVNWNAPLFASLGTTKALDVDAAQGHTTQNNLTIPTVSTVAIAPAFRTPRCSPTSGGRDDPGSLAPIHPTLPLLSVAKARRVLGWWKRKPLQIPRMFESVI